MKKKSENKWGLILEDSGGKFTQGNTFKKATETQIHFCFPQGEGQHEYLGSENVLCILQGNGWFLMMLHQIRSCGLVLKDTHPSPEIISPACLMAAMCQALS